MWIRATGLIGAIILGGVGFGMVFGQTPEHQGLYHGHGLAFLSFVLAGVFYSASGFAKKLRVTLAGNNKEPFDTRKLGKSVAVGVFLGIAAFIWTTYNGETIAVDTFEEMLHQVGLNIAFILAVDKLILGSGATKSGPEYEQIRSGDWSKVIMDANTGNTDNSVFPKDIDEDHDRVIDEEIPPRVRPE